MRHRLYIFAFVSVTAVTSLAFAEPKLDDFAARLATLRGEVEELSSRLEEAKQARRADQRSVASQRADLEFQTQREERRVAQLEAQLETRRERIAASSVDGAELVPAVKASFEVVRKQIQDGIPFKQAERLQQLADLEQRLDTGVLTPQRATVQLWALVEDELRLGRENGVYRQIIELEDDELLVDVARLGMVAMYFQTDDGRVGWVRRDDDKWRWATTADEVEKRQVHLLFDAMRKQIRTGYFELPGDLGGSR